MKKIGWGLIILGIIGSGFALKNRIALDRVNRQVELVLDYEEVVAFSQQLGLPVKAVLNHFQQEGINSLTLNEATADYLERRGVLALSYSKRGTLLTVLQPQFLSPLKRNLELKFGAEQVKIIDSRTIELAYPLEKTTPLGFFNSDDLRGFKVWLRPTNIFSSPDFIMYFADQFKLFLQGVIFEGEEVLGYPQYLFLTKEVLKEQDLLVGLIEFFPQKGMSFLVKKELSPYLVRVHSISQQELKNMQKEDKDFSFYPLLARWLRAVRERNIRLVYIHLFLKLLKGQNPDLLELNKEYVRELRAGIEQSGFNCETVGSLPQIKVGRFGLFLGGLGVLGALGLLFNWRGRAFLVWTLLFMVFFLLCLFTGQTRIYQQLVGLTLTVLFPLLGLRFVQRLAVYSPSVRLVLRHTVYLFLLTCLISLSGGITLSGFLSDSDFIFKLEQFRGIKLSLILPFLISFWWLFIRSRNNLKTVLAQPLKTGYLLLAGFLALAGLILILRSGNEGQGFFWPGEQPIREFLETSLGARPRFKEFALGHPALLLGLFIAQTLPASGWGNFLLWVGLAGQVSLINSFCHLHTPFVFTLVRTLNGVCLGIVLGFILIFIFHRLYKRFDYND